MSTPSAPAADRGARLSGGASMMTCASSRSRPRRAEGAGGQVDLPPRRAARRDGLLAGAHRELPARRRYHLDTQSRACAGRARGGARARRSSCAGPACARPVSRRPDRRWQRRHALAPLPGWLAAQEGRSFTLDGDASIRRRPVDRVAEPLALMGAQLQAREGALPAILPCAADGCTRSPTSCLSRALRSSRACCSRRSLRTAPQPWASPRAAATTPSACCCAPASHPPQRPPCHGRQCR